MIAASPQPWEGGAGFVPQLHVVGGCRGACLGQTLWLEALSSMQAHAGGNDDHRRAPWKAHREYSSTVTRRSWAAWAGIGGRSIFLGVRSEISPSLFRRGGF